MSHAQPSVLLISADDLPRNILGVYGAQHGLTPNIDALAPRLHSPRFDEPAADLAWVARYQATASGYGHQLYAKLNAVARRAFGCGDVVEVIDVEEALSYRIDGHGHDMLHWCLPGVPDWLIAVLFRFVLVDG